MAYEIPGLQWSLEAGEDLSSYQHCFVKLSSGVVVHCDAITDQPIGILQNNPTSGKMATVMVMGISKIKSSEALTADKYVGTFTDATGAPYVHGTDDTTYIVGQVVEPSTAVNELASIMFNCLGVGRAK